MNCSLTKSVFYLVLLLFSVALCTPGFASTPSKAARLIKLGCELSDRGFFQDSITLFDKAIAIDNTCRNAYWDRALAYSNSGKPERALSDLDRLLSTNPRDTESRGLHALSLTRLGMWKKAIRDYNILVKDKAKDPYNYLQRAALFAHVGNAQRAKDDWRRAVKLDPKEARGRLGRYDRYATSDLCDTEADCRFIEPGEKVPDSYLRGAAIEHWSQLDKQVIAQVFCRIKERAPQMVAKALNGEKLCFFLRLEDNGRSGMDSYSGLHYITVYATSLSGSPERLEWLLTHELVHQVDVCDYISNSRDFSKAATPCIARCRVCSQERDWNNVYLWGGFSRFNARAHTYGLPTFYAALNLQEALADCTTAMILYRWQPPAAIGQIIRQRVLAPEHQGDEEAALLSKAVKMQGDPKIAIVDLIKALRLDDSCIYALTSLASYWNECQEPEIGMFYARKALQTLSACDLPPGCSALADVRKLLGDTYYAQGDFWRARDEYSQGIAIEPTYGAYVDRGECYRHIGDYKRAIADYGQALVFNPGDALTRSLLAEVHSTVRRDRQTGFVAKIVRKK